MGRIQACTRTVVCRETLASHGVRRKPLRLHRGPASCLRLHPQPLELRTVAVRVPCDQVRLDFHPELCQQRLGALAPHAAGAFSRERNCQPVTFFPPPVLAARHTGISRGKPGMVYNTTRGTSMCTLHRAVYFVLLPPSAPDDDGTQKKDRLSESSCGHPRTAQGQGSIAIPENLSLESQSRRGNPAQGLVVHHAKLPKQPLKELQSAGVTARRLFV